jgi:hypothetical protein
MANSSECVDRYSGSDEILHRVCSPRKAMLLTMFVRTIKRTSKHVTRLLDNLIYLMPQRLIDGMSVSGHRRVVVLAMVWGLSAVFSSPVFVKSQEASGVSQVDPSTLARQVINALGGASALQQVCNWSVSVSVTSESGGTRGTSTQTWSHQRYTPGNDAIISKRRVYSDSSKDSLTAPNNPFLLEMGIYSFISPKLTTLRSAGTSTINGDNVSILESITPVSVWPHQPIVRDWYIDNSTFLPIMVSFPSSPITHDKATTVSYGDYTRQGTLLLPHLMTVVHASGRTETMTIQSMTLNSLPAAGVVN